MHITLKCMMCLRHAVIYRIYKIVLKRLLIQSVEKNAEGVFGGVDLYTTPPFLFYSILSIFIYLGIIYKNAA